MGLSIKLRNKEVKKIRKEAIHRENLAKEMGKEEPINQREQATSGQLVMCTDCLGIYSSTVIHRHRAKCDNLAEKAIPKSRSSISVKLAKKTNDSFATHILHHFQDDEVQVGTFVGKTRESSAMANPYIKGTNRTVNRSWAQCACLGAYFPSSG